MDQKILIGALFSVMMAVLSWNIKATMELQLSVQRLEILLLEDAMLK